MTHESDTHMSANGTSAAVTTTLTLTVTLTLDLAGRDETIARDDFVDTFREYLTAEDAPFQTDYGLSVSDLESYRENGDVPSTWGGYEGPFVTAVTVEQSAEAI